MDEDEASAEETEPAGVEPRRYPSTIGGLVYVVILVVMVTGLVLAAATDWRLGVRLVAAALGGAGVARLVLPEKEAGMLAVRHRFLDVGLLAAAGLALFVLASSIPDQPV